MAQTMLLVCPSHQGMTGWDEPSPLWMEGREIVTMANSSVIGSAAASASGAPDVPEALQVPTKAVSPGFQVALSLANTVIWLSILPIGTILLPTQIAALNAATRFSN